jgi:2'-5' RNA ligase
LIRLFAALEVPHHIGEGLARRQQGLPGARWRPPDSLHVTLRFFGEIDEARAADLAAELARITGPAPEVVLESVGSAGAGHQLDTVWAGVRDSEPLRVLAGRCEAAARRAGLKPETRTFRPHVTLAYLGRHAQPDRIAAWIAGHNLLASPSWKATWFGLYSSWGSSDGSRYDLERSYILS